MKQLYELLRKKFGDITFDIDEKHIKHIAVSADQLRIPVSKGQLILQFVHKLDAAEQREFKARARELLPEIERLLMIDTQRFLGAVLHISSYLNSIRDFKELINNIINEAEKLLSAEASSIFIKEEKKDALAFFTLTGKAKNLLQLDVPIKGSIAGDVFRHRQIVIDNDVRQSGAYFQKADEVSNFETKTILAAPLMIRDKCIGVIEVLNKASDAGGRFTGLDKEIIKIFASQIAVALENSRLNEEMDSFFTNVIKALSEAIEAKDKYTRGHTDRVSRLSVQIGEKMGLSHQQLKILELSAILHDVGKIGVPEAILNKKSRLTQDEYVEIKKHAAIGAQIIAPIKQFTEIKEGVLHHHERYDGFGYPSGLKGDNIPLIARIISIADTFDTLTTERPYKKAYSKKEAIKEIAKCSGTQFDPKVVKIFNKVINAYD